MLNATYEGVKVILECVKFAFCSESAFRNDICILYLCSLRIYYIPHLYMIAIYHLQNIRLNETLLEEKKNVYLYHSNPLLIDGLNESMKIRHISMCSFKLEI